MIVIDYGVNHLNLHTDIIESLTNSFNRMTLATRHNLNLSNQLYLLFPWLGVLWTRLKAFYLSYHVLAK
jgi:hypothetical protein